MRASLSEYVTVCWAVLDVPNIGETFIRNVRLYAMDIKMFDTKPMKSVSGHYKKADDEFWPEMNLRRRGRSGKKRREGSHSFSFTILQHLMSSYTINYLMGERRQEDKERVILLLMNKALVWLVKLVKLGSHGQTFEHHRNHSMIAWLMELASLHIYIYMIWYMITRIFMIMIIWRTKRAGKGENVTSQNSSYFFQAVLISSSS